MVEQATQLRAGTSAHKLPKFCFHRTYPERPEPSVTVESKLSSQRTGA